MRKFFVALIYTALAATANADTVDIEALKTGDMVKLRAHDQAQDVSGVAFNLADGSTGTMDMYKGKVVVLNFWATWCAPCLKEMPHLSKLQTELGGNDFAVVTIATGRNSHMKMEKFFAGINVSNLPLHTDPKQAFAREMGVMALPVTMIVDRNGREVARMTGDADWSSDSAKTLLRAVISKTGP